MKRRKGNDLLNPLFGNRLVWIVCKTFEQSKERK
jgi:hypothetical protein